MFSQSEDQPIYFPLELFKYTTLPGGVTTPPKPGAGEGLTDLW